MITSCCCRSFERNRRDSAAVVLARGTEPSTYIKGNKTTENQIQRFCNLYLIFPKYSFGC